MRSFTQQVRSAYFLFFLLIFFSSTVVNAQKFAVGLQAAASYNNSYGQGTSTYLPNPIYGGSLGAFGTFQLFEKFKLRAEALFSTRGFNAQYSSAGAPTSSLTSGYQPTLAPSTAVNTGPEGSVFATLKSQTIYLDVPAGVDYEVFPRINLQAGGIASFFLRELNNSLENNSVVGLQQPANTKYHQTLQFYVYGGAYYQFPFGLSAGARANLGLTSSFVQATSGTGNQAYPFSFQIFVAYPLLKF